MRFGWNEREVFLEQGVGATARCGAGPGLASPSRGRAGQSRSVAAIAPCNPPGWRYSGSLPASQMTAAAGDPTLANDRDLLDLSPDDQRKLARAVMRRQGRLSLGVAAAFLGLLLGLPLANATWPDRANAPIGGIPANWLFLGVVFYPIAVVLSIVYVRWSDRIETECVDWRATLDAEDDR